MKTGSLRRRRLQAGLLAELSVLALLVSSAGAGAAEADSFGASTMYSPPSSNSGPKVLYPRALQLKHSGSANGTMLATFENYTADPTSFPVFRSTDAGHTWARYSTISDTVNGWGLRYQPFLYELPSAVGGYAAGTVLAFGNSIPADGSHTKIDMYASTDHGASWSFVSSIASGNSASIDDGQPSVWEPFALVHNGRLVVYYSDQRDPDYAQKIVHETTADLVNWGPVVNDITGTSYDQRPGMPVVAALPNGTWIMSYEYGGAPAGNFAAYYEISNDPENWSNSSAQVLTDVQGGTPASSPYVTWMPTGGPNGTVAMSAESDSAIYLNTDLGAPGHWIRVPSPVDSAYSRALVPLNDNRTLFIMSAGHVSDSNTVTYGAIDLGSTMSSGSTYKLVNRNSNLLLGVQDASTSPGANLLQWNDNGTADHLWLTTLDSDGYWRLTNQNSGLVAGITDISTDDGASAVQWTDSGTPDHQWVTAPYPGGGFVFVNRASGKRLEIGGASTAPGALAQQWEDTGNPCQVWGLVAP